MFLMIISSKLIDVSSRMTSRLVLTIGSKFMKQALLILSVLGMGIAQTSGAAEITFQPNNTLSHTITNISTSANYGSSRNIYSTNSGAHVYSNDEISQAIDNLSAHAKQKNISLRHSLAVCHMSSINSKQVVFLIATLLLLSQRQMPHELHYLEVLATVLAMYVKRYSQQVTNLRLILQLINMPLVAH